MERPRYTLLELSGMIGKSIAGAFPGRYWVVAEINEIRENINGHCYLELVEKDSEHDRIVARLRATIWSGTWRMLRSYFETSTSRELQKGMNVLVEVSVEFHELYGLSLNIRDIDPVYTLGDLERKRAETIRRLEQEGIINMNRELHFPLLPSRVAVVSSPRAAGYEDFMHQITGNQHKYKFETTLFPAIMQGDNATPSVIAALEAIFSQEELFDVVVILRGGGAASDLSGFDTYEIASHIAQMPLPVITGIGHERDRTIAGMVAHTELKTPTAVAEFLIDRFHEVDTRISSLSSRLTREVSYQLDRKRDFINSALKELPASTRNCLKQSEWLLRSRGSSIAVSSRRFLQKSRHRIDSTHTGFGFIIRGYLSAIRNKVREVGSTLLPGRSAELIKARTSRLELLNRTVELVDPENIIRKGYALVYKEGRIIKRIGDIRKEDLLETRIADGYFSSRVISMADKGSREKTGKEATGKKIDAGGQ